jgi:hypothetical protein
MTTTDGFTPAQIWYVARVYPETVTDAEARGPYELAITSEADCSYWETTANVLNRLVDERLKAELRRAEAVIQAARNLDAHHNEGYATLVSYLIRLHEALDAHDGQPALSQS